MLTTRIGTLQSRKPRKFENYNGVGALVRNFVIIYTPLAVRRNREIEMTSRVRGGQTLSG